MDLTRKQMLGGIAGILATCAAPAIMRMPLGARGVAFAPATGGGVPTARSYIQDGLICMYDAIENGGFGIHNDISSVFVDCIDTTHNLTLSNSNSWGDDYLDCADCYGYGTNSGFVIDEFCTLQVVLNGVISDTELHIFHLYPYVGLAKYKNMYIASYVKSVPQIGYASSRSITIVNKYNNGYSPYCGYNDTSPSAFVGSEYWTVNDGNCIRMATWTKGSKIKGYKGKINCVRVYDRELSAAEVAANYAVDKARFGLT